MREALVADERMQIIARARVSEGQEFHVTLGSNIDKPISSSDPLPTSCKLQPRELATLHKRFVGQDAFLKDT